MAEKNICEICGGVKDLVYITEMIPKDATSLTVTASSAPPSKPWGHLCYGHPKGAPKHDGKLDNGKGWSAATVAYSNFYGGRAVDIQGGLGDIEYSGIVLSAKQAISLLSWLEQNRPELTALAEQEQAR